MSISTRLYTLRVDHGYSQDELAQIIGVSRQAVSKWERAESIPDTDKLIALSELYGLTIDEILNGESQEVDSVNTFSRNSQEETSKVESPSLESNFVQEATDKASGSETFSDQASENFEGALPQGSAVLAGYQASSTPPFGENVSTAPSSKRRVALIVCIAVVLLALALIVGENMTKGSEKPTRTSLNAALAAVEGPGVPVESASLASLEIGHDKFFTGKDVIIDGQFEGNLFASGQYVRGSALSVETDAFLAGETVVVSDGEINNALYAAGESVFVGVGDQETRVKAISCSGRNVSVAGTFESARLAGEYVVIDGVFSSDVFVAADTVEVGDSAVIQGTLHVSDGGELLISNDAQVSDLQRYHEWSLGPKGDNNTLFVIILNLLVSLAVVALLLLILGDRPAKHALTLARKYPLRIPIVGALTIVAFPVAVFLLLVTVIGLPFALVVVLILGLLALLCVPFAAICLSRALFPTWNRWGSGLLCAAAIALVASAPILGLVLWIASVMFTTGCLAVTYYTWRKSDKTGKCS